MQLIINIQCEERKESKWRKREGSQNGKRNICYVADEWFVSSNDKELFVFFECRTLFFFVRIPMQVLYKHELDMSNEIIMELGELLRIAKRVKA